MVYKTSMLVLHIILLTSYSSTREYIYIYKQKEANKTKTNWFIEDQLELYQLNLYKNKIYIKKITRN